MGDLPRTGPLAWWMLFSLIVLASIILRLLPLGMNPGRLPGPDLVMCLACAWVLRRPAFVPVFLIAGLVLIEDMLLMRPPGLWAAMMVLGTEILRTRAQFSRELSFVGEWIMVSAVMLAMILGQRLLLAVMFLPQPGFGVDMIGFGFSVMTYPVIVGITRLAFGLHKPATGEVDAMGRPL
jgi:rod shape-determining protein MreD